MDQTNLAFFNKKAPKNWFSIRNRLKKIELDVNVLQVTRGEGETLYAQHRIEALPVPRNLGDLRSIRY
ncbi:MAG: hypothetical protein VXZ70_05670, partial [Pseudomonadota bacterium]|nr:hypothetical protein [Pseudomonadota bacterium]